MQWGESVNINPLKSIDDDKGPGGREPGHRNVRGDAMYKMGGSLINPAMNWLQNKYCP